MPLPRPPEEPEGLLAGLPQLGLAAYALLVLAMMGCSSLCMGATVYGLFTASPSVSGLKSNADVEVWAAGNASGAWGAQVATPERNELALTFVAAAW